MISLAQVIAAMAAGAMLPVMALLTIEVRRLRRTTQIDGREEASAATPERVVDDDVLDQIEAVAQLAAARYEVLAQAADGGYGGRAVEIRSKGHLTLLRLHRAVTTPPGRKRSAQAGGVQRTPTGTYPDTPRRSSSLLTRE